MSEELLQRDLLNSPVKIGKWFYYNIGSTSVKTLKNAGIIQKIDYPGIENRKPDGIILINKRILAVIENKRPSEFNTTRKKSKAFNQAFEVSKGLGSKIAIVTDTVNTYWFNGFTEEPLLDENGNEIIEKVDIENEKFIKLLDKVDLSINQYNSKIKPVKLVNPTTLANQIWQDIWSVSGATPENCLYTFVEIFIFKFLSDLGVLRGLHNFYHLLEMYKTNNENEVLEHYANTIRIKIKELFPKNPTDNTTIINGTIFVSKDDEAIEGYSGVFKKILDRFYDYGKLENIDYDFKSKLFESFLKESISKKNWGQFFTPLNVVKPIVKMCEITQGMEICDPACGVGKFLLEAVLPSLKTTYVVDKGELKQHITLHGYDKGFDKDEQKTIILAKANMLIYFSELIKEHPSFTKEFAKLFNDTFILKTNSILGTLKDPVENKYNLILTNPPYVTSGSSNLKDEIKKDAILEKYYKTNGLGIEGLFMEWIVNALKMNGKAFVIIPDGILIRQHDSKLRKFILDNCFIDALISLPLNTFFTTSKKTYILALTKKVNVNDEQTEPVFSYLVSDIGETLDINRFETEENHLETASIMFNQFKGAKQYFESDDKRFKKIDINFFTNNYSKGWLIDKLWTERERIELGILEEKKVMTTEEFSNYLGDIANELVEYKSIFSEINKKKVVYKEFIVSNLFEIGRGDKKYTKKYGNQNSGIYPVFSASTNGPLTYINSYDYDGEYLTWATNGYAGYTKVISGKFSINGDRGILKPKNPNVNISYVKYILEPILRELAKGRKGEDGKDEFTKVYPSMVKNQKIRMPVSETGEIDVEEQLEVVNRYSLINDYKGMLSKNIEKINNIHIQMPVISNYKVIKIKEIITIIKGNSKYTKKYFRDNEGDYPVYSSQTTENGVVAFIDSYDHDLSCLTWTTDGVHAGTVFLRNGRFSMTTHCGALVLRDEFKNKISIEYLYAYLKPVLKSKAIGHLNKRVTVEIVKDVEIEIPVMGNGEFDKNKQISYFKNFNAIEINKREIVSKLENMKTVSIIYDDNEK